MPEINVKSYNEIVETLENMVEGVKTYKSMEGFPPVVNEQSLVKMITKFKTTRDLYEKSSANAKEMYSEYNAQSKAIREELARYKSMLYGFFGKKNPIVSHFGIRPFKKRTKTQKPVQPDQAA